MAEKNCRACAYSYMEPDSPLICGHPDSGSFGLNISFSLKPVDHCGPDHSKFEQHPRRTPEGDLKSLAQIEADEREEKGEPRRATALDVLNEGSKKK